MSWKMSCINDVQGVVALALLRQGFGDVFGDICGIFLRNMLKFHLLVRTCQSRQEG